MWLRGNTPSISEIQATVSERLFTYIALNIFMLVVVLCCCNLKQCKPWFKLATGCMQLHGSHITTCQSHVFGDIQYPEPLVFRKRSVNFCSVSLLEVDAYLSSVSPDQTLLPVSNFNYSLGQITFLFSRGVSYFSEFYLKTYT